MSMKGPFGFWPFPLINLLMSLGQRSNNGSLSPPRLTSGNRLSLSSPVVVNSEEISWTDWKGRKRDMTIKREISQS